MLNSDRSKQKGLLTACTSPEVSANDQGDWVLKCKYCGPRGIIKLKPKCSTLESSINSHLSSKQLVDARKGGLQSKISAFVTASENATTTESSLHM